MSIIFGVGFGALNTGNNLLYLVFALMLAFLVLSGILSETSLRGVSVERVLPRELFAGMPQLVVLRIRNAQPRIAAFALSVEDRLETDAGESAAGRCFALRVGPASTVERSYAWSPPRRGIHHFVSLTVSTRFPFGLFVKSLVLELPGDALVYPALIALARMQPESPSRSAAHDRPGRSPAGDALASVREFVRGDSAARVQWRRSLRSGRLVVGEREGQTASEVEILLPLAPEIPAAAQEERISRATSEIVEHLAAGHRVGLRTRSARFTPGSGPAHRRELLAFLAEIPVEHEERAAPSAPASEATG